MNIVYVVYCVVAINFRNALWLICLKMFAGVRMLRVTAIPPWTVIY